MVHSQIVHIKKASPTKQATTGQRRGDEGHPENTSVLYSNKKWVDRASRLLSNPA